MREFNVLDLAGSNLPSMVIQPELLLQPQERGCSFSQESGAANLSSGLTAGPTPPARARGSPLSVFPLPQELEQPGQDTERLFKHQATA